MAQVITPLRPGTTLDSRYEILDVVSHRPTSVVYRAREITSAAIVAIKQLRMQTPDDAALARLSAATSTISQLQSASTNRLLGLWLESDWAFVVSELHAGRSLQERLSRQGKVAALEAISVVRQLFVSLAEAHGRAIWHGDLKPAHIMSVDATSLTHQLVVLDYIVGHLDRSVPPGRDDAVTYDTFYQAPEIVRGGAHSSASDLFAVGVILLEMIAGRAVVEAACRDPVAALAASNLPKRLCEAIQVALAEDPADRYPSTRQFASALAAVRFPRPPGSIASVPDRRPEKLEPQPTALPGRSQVLTTVDLTLLKGLVGRVRKLSRDQRKDPPQGWSRSDVDPNDVLKIFAPLALLPRVELHAYQFREGRNGHGVVFAHPSAGKRPKPPMGGGSSWAAPLPEAADTGFMCHLVGDGNPLCYALASILWRELTELGALGHGVSWGFHHLVESLPESHPLDPGPPIDKRSWRCSRLGHDHPWTPTVELHEGHHLVRFYSYSGFETFRLFCHVDRYEGAGFVARTTEEVVAQGPRGFIV